MKAKLAPVYFDDPYNPDFRNQLGLLGNLLSGEAEFLPPVKLGEKMPAADAAIFPQLLGNAYRQTGDFRKIGMPILAVTSRFGTMAMWDWEIVSFMKEEGIGILAPYNLRHTRIICRSLSVKRELAGVRFLVFQDNPGEGFQPEIFKRFFWWEDACSRRIKEKFGVEIVRRSFMEFGRKAREIPDGKAREILGEREIKTCGVSEKALLSAAKVYIAAMDEVDKDPGIGGIGINCLNESRFSDTTPCLALDRLFAERGIIWGCEADTLSMMTMYLAHKCLEAPVMMTNIYPYLMGQAPLEHEHIDHFPLVDNPENCILLAHCGYLGLVPGIQANEWTLRKKVLAIVDENSTAVDARIPQGHVTMVKLGPSLDRMTVAGCMLEKYVQYPGSHCLNGAVVRVPDGHNLMKNASSHHQCFLSGEWVNETEIMGRVLGTSIEKI